MAETKHIVVKSLVGQRTGTGAVMLRLGEEFVNLPLERAREVAQHLVECAAAAQHYADLLALMRSIGESDDHAQVLLIALREMRERGEDGKE